MAGIELKNISKVYGNAVVAVDDISLEVKDGEFMIFLGPSGCGKSTTLRMIGGLESISKGDLLIGGRRMNDVDPADRDIAIVFQNYALYPHMTVAGNLGFGLKLRGVARHEIEQRVRTISAMMGIEPLLERKPAQLSGGQRQRVALGRALVRNPQAFLLDEPLSNLDAKLRAAMRTELIKLHHKVGTTIIHVTHDQIEAMTMGQRICIMKDGHIIQVGAPLQVYRNPVNTFVAGFLASPPMNLVGGRLESVGQGQLHAVIGQARLPIPEAFKSGYASHVSNAVTVGLRPEDFHQTPSGDSSVAVKVVTVAVELLGPEVILVAELGGPGGPEIMARMPRDFMARPGEQLDLHYDLTQMHLFDAPSGNVLDRPQIV